MKELDALPMHLDALIRSLSPAQQKELTRNVGKRLRASQAARIKDNRNPDGSAYEPRKTRIREQLNGGGKQLRQHKGAIRRRAMFRRIHRVKFLKASVDKEGVNVGFNAAVSRIARIHQYGLRAKVGKHGPEVDYPKRELLGFTEEDVQALEDAVIEHLAKNLKG